MQVMENGTARVADGTASIRQVGEQFQSIIERIDDIREQVNDIAGVIEAVDKGRIISSMLLNPLMPPAARQGKAPG